MDQGLEIRELKSEIKGLKDQIKRSDVNFFWLLAQINVIHSILCPGRVETWQGRTLQVVEAAKKIGTVRK